MLKTKTKKRVIKIILTVLLSLVVVTNTPAIVNHFTDNNTSTVYAADEGQSADEEDESTTPTPTVPTTADEQSINLASALTSVQGFLNRLIWPILVMIGGLIQNDLLFGSGMEARLREIWIPIRNIVNILFVIGLVAIALYNILGIGEEGSTYSLKAILPKIIIGIIAVNFSFLGIKVFLDGINVLTSSVFALPTQVELGGVLDPEIDQDKIKRFCKLTKGKKLSDNISHEELQEEGENEIHKIVGSQYATAGGFKIKAGDTANDVIVKVETSSLSDVQKGQFHTDVENALDGQICIGLKLTAQGEAFLKDYGSQNAALAMALNLSQILFYEDLDINVDNIEKLLTNLFLSTILYIVFLVSFLALFIVLLARLVVLWLVIALSPVLLLGIAIPVVKEKLSGFGDLSSKFVQTAIAPLSIALAMSIGWIMLNSIKGLNNFDSNSAFHYDLSNGIPVMGLNTLQDLIVAVGTIAVVWLGVFGAASKTVAQPVTDMLKGGIQKVGSFVGTLPLKHMPIMPIKIAGKEDTYTYEQLKYTLNNMDQIRGKGKEPDKLYRALTGGAKAIDKRYLMTPGNINKPDDLYGWLQTRKSDKGTDLRDALKEFKDSPHGREVYRKIGETSPRIQKSIDKLVTATDKEADTAKKALFGHDEIKKTTPLKSETEKAKEEEKKVPPKKTREARIRDERMKKTKLTTAGGEPKELDEIVEPGKLEGAVRELDTSINALKIRVGQGASQEDIKSRLRTVRIEGKDGKTYRPQNAAELKKTLTEAGEGDTYKGIITTFGGEEKGEKDLDTFLEELAGEGGEPGGPTTTAGLMPGPLPPQPPTPPTTV